jgi:hypothetical protein
MARRENNHLILLKFDSIYGPQGEENDDDDGDEAYLFWYKLKTPLAWIKSYVLGYVENPSHLKEEKI